MRIVSFPTHVKVEIRLEDIIDLKEAISRAATLSDFEPLARQVLPHMEFEYAAGGAGDEATLRANQEAFQRVRLRPRMLVDVSKIDTSLEIFGEKLASPIILAPCAYQRLFHPDGELATVQGANDSGTVLMASTASTVGIDEMAKASSRPLWFQLYASSDRGFTRALVQRVEAAGCTVLCLTVDAPIRGIRDRDIRTKFALPPGIERPNFRGLNAAAVTGNPRPTGRSIYSPNLDPAFDWRALDWLLGVTNLPLLVKGILTGSDAARAVAAGVAGIVVSNHGARTVDTVPATIEALPEVADAVAGRVPIILDSGIRRGTDIVKALAMGARAVMIGRPYLYGLAVDGAAGVARIVEILRMELEMAMGLCGRCSLQELDSPVLW